MILQFVTNSKKPKPGGPVIPTPTDQTFSYDIDTLSYSSAIIEKNGKKVRHLWGFERGKTVGEFNDIPFDGLDDDGKPLAAGTYDVKIITHNLGEQWEGPGYNSSYLAMIGKTDAEKKVLKLLIHKGLDPIHDMCFTEEFIYKVKGYGEGSSPIQKIPIDKPQECTQLLTPTYAGPPHMERVCTDGTTVFFTCYDGFQDSIEVFTATNIGIGVNPIVTIPTGRIAKGALIKFTSIAGGSVQFNGSPLLNQELEVIDIISTTQLRVQGTSTGTSFTSASIKSSSYTFIAGLNVSDNKEKVFSSGVTPVLKYGNTALYTAIGALRTFEDTIIKGIAVQRTSGNYLFGSRPEQNQIIVLNKTTGAFVRNVTIDSPEWLAINEFEGQSKLIAITDAIAREYTINSDGTLTVTAKTFPGLVRPLSVDVCRVTGNITFVDGDTSQQKKFYENDGTFIRTPDIAGGYSLNAEFADNKMYVQDLRGVKPNFIKFQLDGDYWAGDGGIFQVRKHDGTTDAVLDRIFYLPRTYAIYGCLNDKTRVFAGDSYLEFSNSHSGDYPEHLQLTHAWGYHIPPNTHSQYVGSKSPVYTNGTTLALVSNTGSDSNVQVVELVEGGVMEFTGRNFTKEVRFYEDGSLRFNENGSGGTQFYRRYNLTGWSGGLPTFSSAVTNNTTDGSVKNGGAFFRPGEITTDGHYIARAADKSLGFHLAAFNASGERMWTGERSTPTNKTGDFPKDGSYNLGHQVMISGTSGPGDVAFTVGNFVITHYFGEKWNGNGSQAHIFNVWYRGHFLFQFGIAKNGNSTGNPIEGMAGNAFSSFGHQDGNNIYVFSNDEGTWAGLHRNKISGLDTIVETTTTVTVTTSPGTNQPPTNYRIGLNTTSELKAWKDRYVAKNKFYSKSDVKTNSPGIVAEMTTMANQLLNNPLIDRYTGPTYYKSGDTNINYSGSYYYRQNSYPDATNKGSRVKAAAILAAAGETKYIPAIKEAILDFISLPVNQYPDHDADWPANGTRWKPNVISDINSGFIETQKLRKFAESYGLIESSFTATQKESILDCLHPAAMFWAKEMNEDIGSVFTNRNPVTNKHAEGLIFSRDYTGSQRKMFDGSGTPKCSEAGLIFNNRRGDKAYFIAVVGVLTNDDYLLSSAYTFVKEWLKFSCYPWNGEVLPGELERASENGFNDKGVSYSIVMVGLMAGIAHYFEIYKKNPVTNVEYPSLFGYTTTEGYAPSGGYSSVGGPKSIGIVGKSVLKLVNGELNLTYNGVKLDGYRESPLWHFTEDTTLAAALYAYYKDPWFEKSALRAHPGSRPFPAGGQGSGVYKPYEGFGGGDWWLFTRFFYDTQTALY